MKKSIFDLVGKYISTGYPCNDMLCADRDCLVMSTCDEINVNLGQNAHIKAAIVMRVSTVKTVMSVSTVRIVCTVRALQITL